MENPPHSAFQYPGKVLTGRFAPSPTGVLHLGNLRTALASWLSARSQGGNWIVRMEDVDGPRCHRDLGVQQLRDLAQLGLDSDGPVIWQSEQTFRYESALSTLARAGHLYACRCSRKDLAGLASAPHAADGLRPYPGICRERKVASFLKDALRVRLPEGSVIWEDLLLGLQNDDPAGLTGDPVLHRRDGCMAYHLAVVVDDGFQGVTEVVRGSDLRGVTSTQIRIQQLLGFPQPKYAHLGMVVGPDGSRLGKRDGALGLSHLAARGHSPAHILGWLGWSLGCLPQPEPCQVGDLIPAFSWKAVPQGPVAIPPEWA